MNAISEAKTKARVVQAGVIGAGDYATAIVTQAERIPNLNISIVADVNLVIPRSLLRGR